MIVQGTLIVLDLPQTPPIYLWVVVKPPTKLKSISDYPNNMCQTRLKTLSLIQVWGGRGGVVIQA